MISCNNYDYIEIACMHRLAIRLHMFSGDIIEGLALDTTRTDSNKEAILVDASNVSIQSTFSDPVTGPIKIELEHIRVLEAITANPHFTKVDFNIH